MMVVTKVSLKGRCIFKAIFPANKHKINMQNLTFEISVSFYQIEVVVTIRNV